MRKSEKIRFFWPNIIIHSWTFFLPMNNWWSIMAIKKLQWALQESKEIIIIIIFYCHHYYCYCYYVHSLIAYLCVCVFVYKNKPTIVCVSIFRHTNRWIKTDSYRQNYSRLLVFLNFLLLPFDDNDDHNHHLISSIGYSFSYGGGGGCCCWCPSNHSTVNCLMILSIYPTDQLTIHPFIYSFIHSLSYSQV